MYVIFAFCESQMKEYRADDSYKNSENYVKTEVVVGINWT
jgi:hypothetical protein